MHKTGNMPQNGQAYPWESSELRTYLDLGRKTKNCNQMTDIVNLIHYKFGASTAGPDSLPALKQTNENF